MQRLIIQSFRLAILSIILLTLPPVTAQTSSLVTMTKETLTVLNDLNTRRGKQSFVLLTPNDILNQVAKTYLDDLFTRSQGVQDMAVIGDPFLTSDGKNLEKVLEDKGYPQYSDGYVADLMVLTGNFDPTNVLSTWYKNRQAKGYLSRKMAREGSTVPPPIFSFDYREIGIAYALDTTTTIPRHFYVLVFGAQPGVLPALITERNNKYLITDTITSPDVTLYINSEYSHDDGDGNSIGEVKWIRITDQPEKMTCPTGEENGWAAYRTAVFRSLTGDYGKKTLYIQLCDASGRTMSVAPSVNYVAQQVDISNASGGTPTPNVMIIANATQTAAAIATSYAPYQPMVESILTGTAAAISIITPTP
jgi:hypothetical protein